MSCISENGSNAPYDDVSFDFGRAQSVINKLDDLSKNVTVQERDRDATAQALFRPATGDWTGSYADQFKNDIRTMHGDFQDLQGKLRRLRDKLAAAVDAANREKRCRDSANATYNQQTPPVGP